MNEQSETRAAVLRIQQATLEAIPAGADYVDIIYALALVMRDMVDLMKAGKLH